MRPGHRLAVAAGTAAALAALAAPAPASAATVFAGRPASAADGPYCPERAPFMGMYLKSYIGSNGHHYDIYLGPLGWPFPVPTVDCDA